MALLMLNIIDHLKHLGMKSTLPETDLLREEILKLGMPGEK